MLPMVYEVMKKRREKGCRRCLFYSIVQGLPTIEAEKVLSIDENIVRQVTRNKDKKKWIQVHLKNKQNTQRYMNVLRIV